MIDNYYSVLSCTTTDHRTGVVSVHLNAGCCVYEGHFPGNPVSPGVCNINMIRECAELISQCKLRIVRVKQCRLTTLVTPLTHPQIDVTIDLQEQEDGAFRLNASIGKDGDNYLTLKAEMKNE